MCDESEVVFYGMNLWSYYDSVISTNTLIFDYYAYNKSDRLASPKFKISIYGKAAEGSKVNIGSSELYKFAYQLKNKILNQVKACLAEMKTNQDYTTGFSYNNGKGKNIYVTLMWNSLLNGPVVRFMIGEKEKTILESDKVYIPIVEFFSFCEILDQAFKNYITLCSSVVQENSVKKLYDLIENIDFQSFKKETITENTNNSVSIPVETILDVKLESNKEELKKTVPEEPAILTEISKTEVEKDNESDQNNFDSFLKENRDNFELDMAKPLDELVKEETNPDPVASSVEEIVKSSKFIEKVCNNDLSKLEETILNCCNEDLPLNSFINEIKRVCDIDFEDGIDIKDYIALNYTISRQIKTKINLLLEKQIKLPSSIAPVVIKNNKRTDDKLDATYYLLLLFIYTSKVRTALIDKTNNSVDNKDVFNYLIKMITNPIVFSYIPETQLEVIKSEVYKRYNQLLKINFFDNFINGIKEKISGFDLQINKNDINEAIDKIYNNVMKFGDKLNPGILFDANFMKLSYDDIKNNDLTIDNLRKIIRIDSSLYKFNKIDFDSLKIKSTDDLPIWILNKYNIKTTKFDTTIIQKFFKEFYKDSKQLEHISKINKDVYDILDKIDLDEFDDNGLKALYFWNTEELPKKLTYKQFVDMVNKSSLEKAQLISMIINREKVVDPNFFTSFLVSAEDSV